MKTNRWMEFSNDTFYIFVLANQQSICESNGLLMHILFLILGRLLTLNVNTCVSACAVLSNLSLFTFYVLNSLYTKYVTLYLYPLPTHHSKTIDQNNPIDSTYIQKHKSQTTTRINKLISKTTRKYFLLLL